MSVDAFKNKCGSAYKYSPIKLWPRNDCSLHRSMGTEAEQNHIKHKTMNLSITRQTNSRVELKAWADDRSIIYFISTGGLGKMVCLCFDGDAAVSRFTSVSNELPPAAYSKQRGRSPVSQSEPEHVRQISPERDALDELVFETAEASEGFFVSTWDLDSIPDAEDLGRHVLEPWFDSFADEMNE